MPTGWVQRRAAHEPLDLSRSLRVKYTVAKRHAGTLPFTRSVRSTCGKQSAPRSKTKVRTAGRRVRSQLLRTSSLWISQAGRGPEPSGQGSRWQTFASPSRSLVASGTAKSGSALAPLRARTALAAVGDRLGKQQHAEAHQHEDPDRPGILVARPRDLGRPPGSGWVRSRSASRSPTACRSSPPRSSKRSALTARRRGRAVVASRAARAPAAAGRGRAGERPVLLRPQERRRQHEHDAEQGDAEVHDRNDAEVAQHADVGGDQDGEAGDGGRARGEHGRAGRGVGQLDRPRRAGARHALLAVARRRAAR